MLKQTAVSRFFLGLLLIGVFAAIVVVACSRDSESPDDSDMLLPAKADAGTSPKDSDDEGSPSVPVKSEVPPAKDTDPRKPDSQDTNDPPGVPKESKDPPSDDTGMAPEKAKTTAVPKKVDPPVTPDRSGKPDRKTSENEKPPAKEVATKTDLRKRFPRMYARRKGQRKGATLVKPLPPPDVVEPKVVMTEEHAQTCLVRVGDQMPDFSLPDSANDPHALTDSFGEKLTVVVFWNSQNAYAVEQFERLELEVLPFSPKGVGCIAIHVGEAAAEMPMLVGKYGGDLLCLQDFGQNFFQKVATQKLPRTYLLDERGKILWFDMEYSRMTRTSLRNALRFHLEGPTPKAKQDKKKPEPK